MLDSLFSIKQVIGCYRSPYLFLYENCLGFSIRIENLSQIENPLVLSLPVHRDNVAANQHRCLDTGSPTQGQNDGHIKGVTNAPQIADTGMILNNGSLIWSSVTSIVPGRRTDRSSCSARRTPSWYTSWRLCCRQSAMLSGCWHPGAEPR